MFRAESYSSAALGAIKDKMDTPHTGKYTVEHWYDFEHTCVANANIRWQDTQVFS